MRERYPPAAQCHRHRWGCGSRRSCHRSRWQASAAGADIVPRRRSAFTPRNATTSPAEGQQEANPRTGYGPEMRRPAQRREPLQHSAHRQHCQRNKRREQQHARRVSAQSVLATTSLPVMASNLHLTLPAKRPTVGLMIDWCSLQHAHPGAGRDQSATAETLPRRAMPRTRPGCVRGRRAAPSC